MGQVLSSSMFFTRSERHRIRNRALLAVAIILATLLVSSGFPLPYYTRTETGGTFSLVFNFPVLVITGDTFSLSVNTLFLIIDIILWYIIVSILIVILQILTRRI